MGRMITEHITAAVAEEREAILVRIEEQRQKILGTPGDPSWTEHLAEIQSWIKTR